jgi:hypothetical protein
MATTEGVKYDEGKARIDLIPPELLIALGEVLQHGAAKYGERNWEKGMNWGRCYAAAMRHLLAWSMGEEIDAESGLPHLAHAATNVAFLYAFASREVGADDRAPFFKTRGVKPEVPELAPMIPTAITKPVLAGGPVPPLETK